MEACSKPEGKGEAKFRGSVAPRTLTQSQVQEPTETERHILTTKEHDRVSRPESA